MRKKNSCFKGRVAGLGGGKGGYPRWDTWDMRASPSGESGRDMRANRGWCLNSQTLSERAVKLVNSTQSPGVTGDEQSKKRGRANLAYSHRSESSSNKEIEAERRVRVERAKTKALHCTVSIIPLLSPCDERNRGTDLPLYTQGPKCIPSRCISSNLQLYNSRVRPHLRGEEGA